jgi:hypothetical protein
MRLKCGRWTISPGLREATPSTRSVFASTNCFDESIVEGGDGQKEEEESRVAPSSHPDPDESTSVRPPDLHQQGQPGHGGERERERAHTDHVAHRRPARQAFDLPRLAVVRASLLYLVLPCLPASPPGVLTRRPSLQFDRHRERSLLAQSTTLYVGNLSFYTTEQQIYESWSPLPSPPPPPNTFVCALAAGIRAHLTVASPLLTSRPPAHHPAVFSRCSSPLDGGGLKRIIMGLDRHNKCVRPSPPPLPSSTARSPASRLIRPRAPGRTPCGFCFVEFYTHAEALASMRYISGSKLDERVIRCDLDPGYREGRQFGRGKNGGQVRSLPPLSASLGAMLLPAPSLFVRGGWVFNGDGDDDGRQRDGPTADPQPVVSRALLLPAHATHRSATSSGKSTTLAGVAGVISVLCSSSKRRTGRGRSSSTRSMQASAGQGSEAGTCLLERAQRAVRPFTHSLAPAPLVGT